jgi:hypothetical protein
MKIVWLTFLLVYFSLAAKAQSDWKKESDSSAIESRTKADKVLSHFDTLIAPKLLYSFEDRYFYLIVKDTPCYKEYYIEVDSLGKLLQFHVLNEKKIMGKKQRRQAEQYRNLLCKGNPFNLSQYHSDFVIKMPEAKYISGKQTYFVVKDIESKRYGEYRLSAITIPSPMDKNLWSYLFRRLSEEIANNDKAP